MTLSTQITRTEAPSCEVQIFIGGDHATCKNLCAEHALTGACYSVEPTEFVYTGGRETGSVVRLINYPRFPAESDEIMQSGLALAEFLLLGLHQSSCTVQGPTRTVWMSRRGEA